jgi:hypothetical protein
MRLLIVILIVVTLIIVDQAWYGGMYMTMAATALRQMLARVGF